jgi:hypothetical protein
MCGGTLGSPSQSRGSRCQRRARLPRVARQHDELAAAQLGEGFAIVEQDDRLVIAGKVRIASFSVTRNRLPLSRF